MEVNSPKSRAFLHVLFLSLVVLGNSQHAKPTGAATPSGGKSPDNFAGNPKHTDFIPNANVIPDLKKHEKDEGGIPSHSDLAIPQRKRDYTEIGHRSGRKIRRDPLPLAYISNSGRTNGGSSGLACVTKYVHCGKTCGTKIGGKCLLKIPVPKMCKRMVPTKVLCPGKKAKMCSYMKKVPSICKSSKAEELDCTSQYRTKKRVCKWIKRSVEEDKKTIERCRNFARCSMWKRRACKYETKSVACSKPKTPCKECAGGFLLRNCPKQVQKRVEVPCPRVSPSPRAAPSRKPSPPPSTPPAHKPRGASAPRTPPRPSPRPSSSTTPRPSSSTTPRPSSSTTPRPSSPIAPRSPFATAPMPFSDKGSGISTVMCFASLFEEDKCSKASRFCRLISDDFNSVRCTIAVCQDCKRLRFMHVSKKLRAYCQQLVRSDCKLFSSTRQLTADTNNGIVEIHNRVSRTRKCFRTVTTTVNTPCNEKLPAGEVCSEGCRLKAKCEKKVLQAGVCKDNLPALCKEKEPEGCMTLFKPSVKSCKDVWVTPSKKTCNLKLPSERVCYKHERKWRPCAAEQKEDKGVLGLLKKNFGDASKLCEQMTEEKYVCGQTHQRTAVSCTQNSCKPKFCSQKVCGATNRAQKALVGIAGAGIGMWSGARSGGRKRGVVRLGEWKKRLESKKRIGALKGQGRKNGRRVGGKKVAGKREGRSKKGNRVRRRNKKGFGAKKSRGRKNGRGVRGKKAAGKRDGRKKGDGLRRRNKKRGGKKNRDDVTSKSQGRKHRLRRSSKKGNENKNGLRRRRRAGKKGGKRRNPRSERGRGGKKGSRARRRKISKGRRNGRARKETAKGKKAETRGKNDRS